MGPVKVKDIMTVAVVTTRLETTVGDVARLLGRHRISAVPVLNGEGTLAGLVSEADLLAKQGSTAGEVMTTALITVTEDAEVDDVRHLLIERGIRRVPVVSGATLVGIVSRADVVATMATEWACHRCGEAVRSPEPPARCPRCHGGPDSFVTQEQPPGS
jgi:CBS-domain-containing membrane protein